MFTHFSSAFNTLNPDIVVNKPRTLNVSPILCKFILDFLTNRERRVRINDILSTVLSISTGAPQSYVGLLSAILLYCYTVYYTHTHELRSRFRNIIVIWSTMLMIQLLSVRFLTMMKVNTMNIFLKLSSGLKLTICCWMLRKLKS